MRSNPEEIRAVAFYLPQFHIIPENDQWWGRGFTDWRNVKKARPLYPGHNQPRVPLGGNYYDLSQKEALRWQIQLARSYGIHGFCHYHYWFEGKQLLETPTDLFLSSPELDHSFCLAWANSTWSRAWDGDENAQQVLIKQTHRPDRNMWLRHFQYLIKAWSDRRAIRVNGKSVFLIYSPHTIDRVGDMLSYWRELAVQHGLPGIHFVAMQQFSFLNREFLNHFDAVVEFQPAVAMLIPQRDDVLFSRIRMQKYLRAMPDWILKPLRRVQKKLPDTLRFHDYDELWGKILSAEPDTSLVTYPGAFMDWDNTSRYGTRARIVVGANPKRFHFWFQQLVDKVRRKPPQQRIIFINAWNEWAEGTYLEPDERFGCEYLEAIKQSLG